MKIVPVIKSSDLPRSLHFYTEVLDFERKWPGYEDREMANGVIDLVREGVRNCSFHVIQGTVPSVLLTVCLWTTSMSVT
jgi:catechol 2,3-dioxygenase-like lactoylglutathione lyase family enzyme